MDTVLLRYSLSQTLLTNNLMKIISWFGDSQPPHSDNFVPHLRKLDTTNAVYPLATLREGHGRNGHGPTLDPPEIPSVQDRSSCFLFRQWSTPGFRQFRDSGGCIFPHQRPCHTSEGRRSFADWTQSLRQAWLHVLPCVCCKDEHVSDPQSIKKS